MTKGTGTGGRESSEDQEAVRLAKTRLMRVCRLDGQAAQQALERGAMEQKTALLAVALRVLAASPEDLAAGRVVPTPRRAEPAGLKPRRPGQQRPQGNWQGSPGKRPRRRPRKER